MLILRVTGVYAYCLMLLWLSSWCGGCPDLAAVVGGRTKPAFPARVMRNTHFLTLDTLLSLFDFHQHQRLRDMNTEDVTLRSKEKNFDNHPLVQFEFP
ncbi:hypothetical protein BP00DRAFT_55360 [Aspergillus indologenus CBS 114.80]|uniref:Uncharacterized protein n=1 Tax=Aspergillus indologenus CBS 114.80 TaxID=1450541 RepID=A0A2V5ID07_9EURO|nr:hypothetical protein BP00DRAFT_55360 [Aspergillus indologenus CBS 114.80]